MIKSEWPFGLKSSLDFKKGDLVHWSEWVVVNKELLRMVKLGVFLGKEVKYVGNREVVYGKVLCAETGDVLKLLTIRLKKKSN